MSYLRELSVLTNDLRADKFDNRSHIDAPLRPDFPVAPPETPDFSAPLPDLYVTFATSPSCGTSPPFPQEEGFLAVPTRTARGRIADITPRPLPTPPVVPRSYSVLEVGRHQCTNGTSHPPTCEPLATPDLSTCDIVAALFYADSVVTTDDESLSHDVPAGLQQRSPSDIASDIVSVTTSSDSPSEPRDSPLTLGNTLVEEVRDTAADMEFLDELGLSAEDYMQLLESMDYVQLVAKEEGRD